MCRGIKAGLQAFRSGESSGGCAVGKVEARFATLGERKLAYLVNFNSSSPRLRIEAATDMISFCTSFGTVKKIRGNEVTVPAHLDKRSTRYDDRPID